MLRKDANMHRSVRRRVQEAEYEYDEKIIRHFCGIGGCISQHVCTDVNLVPVTVIRSITSAEETTVTVCVSRFHKTGAGHFR